MEGTFINNCRSFLKLSVLCLYLRLTPDSNHKRTIWIIITIIAAHGIEAIFVRCSASPFVAPRR